MSLLQDKVIAITGAGGGLGRAYALYMAGLGAKLVVNDVGGSLDGSGQDQSMADAVVAEVTALGAEAVANHASVATMEGGASIVETAVKSFGRIDGLINNAGILRDKTLLKMDEAMWDAVIAVHLKGCFSCSLAAAKQMKSQGGGSIVNTTSFAGLKGNFGQTNYAAAKAGIYAMTLVNAMELGRLKIRVNAVAPLAKTRMTEELAMVPSTMTADHVAPMVALLVSDRGSDITGRIFGVHGGHVFEYKMQTTDGVEKADWSPQDILENMAAIEGAAVPTPAAPADEAQAPQKSTAPQTPQDQVEAVFHFMPSGFVAEKAKGYNAVLHWEVEGSGDYTITIAEGACRSCAGKQGSATCVIKTDTKTFLGITDGSLDGTQAYMAGKISASNVADLIKYQKVIDPKKAKAAFDASLQLAPSDTGTTDTAVDGAAVAKPVQKSAASAPQTPQEKVAATFKYMPAGFVADKAKGFSAVLQWEVAGSGDYTITIGDGECRSKEGKADQPTCVIKTDTPTFLGITDGSIDGTQAYMAGKITATNVADLMKYQKVIDPKKAMAAFDAEATATAETKPPAAKPAAARPQKAEPKKAEPAPEPTINPLETLAEQEKLKLLLGLLPSLVGEVKRTETTNIFVECGDLLCTLAVEQGKLTLAAGLVGQPTCQVVASAATLWRAFCGQHKGDADGLLTTSNMSQLQWLIQAAGKDPQAALETELVARGQGLNRDSIGTFFHGDPQLVSAQEILDFAEASSDPNPCYTDPKRPGGLVAPPLFAVRYFNQIYAKALTDPALGLDVTKLLFGEMEMTFGRPIRAKDLLVVKAKVLDIEDKETGQIMRFNSRLMCEGEVAVDSIASFFIRWENKSRIQRLKLSGVESAESEKVAFEHATTFREDQTKLFAAASNDPNPVHFDERFAKAAGLPGIIVHGLCSMAFCARAFVQEVCQQDPALLHSIKVRFSKPAYPKQTLTTKAFAPATENDLVVYPFVASSDQGQLVITEGVAKIKKA